MQPAYAAPERGTRASAIADTPVYASATLQPSRRENSLATYLFALVQRDATAPDNCGRFDAKVAESFEALLSEVDYPGAKHLRERLLTGPSAPGEVLLVDRRPRWFYTACQAHECDVTRLALLYDPATTHMVGRLIVHCNTRWLGDPDAAQRVMLEEKDLSTCDPQPAVIGGWRRVSDQEYSRTYHFSMLPRLVPPKTRLAVYDWRADRVVCCLVVDGGEVSEARLKDELHIPGVWVTDLANGGMPDGAPYRTKVALLKLDEEMAGHQFPAGSDAAGGLLISAGSKIVAPHTLDILGKRYRVTRREQSLADDDGGLVTYRLENKGGDAPLEVEVRITTY